MKDKKGLILGLANERAIAWGIAKACREAGASLAFTYQGTALGKRVEPLAKTLDSELILPCQDCCELKRLNPRYEGIINILTIKKFKKTP